MLRCPGYVNLHLPIRAGNELLDLKEVFLANVRVAIQLSSSTAYSTVVLANVRVAIFFVKFKNKIPTQKFGPLGIIFEVDSVDPPHYVF